MPIGQIGAISCMTLNVEQLGPIDLLPITHYLDAPFLWEFLRIP